MIKKCNRLHKTQKLMKTPSKHKNYCLEKFPEDYHQIKKKRKAGSLNNFPSRASIRYFKAMMDEGSVEMCYEFKIIIKLCKWEENIRKGSY